MPRNTKIEGKAIARILDAQTRETVGYLYEWNNGAVETVTAPLVHGRLSKRDLGDALWKPLLEGFRNTSRVELTVGDTTRIVELGDPVAFTCV